jgi:predicted house-cleaning noncanonical NTP pyrophosphatase (MazG superfamily)
MRSFLLDKLVRDKVFTSMQELEQVITHRTLDNAEFLQELQRKLLEECNEFDPDDPKEAANELADLLEVIETIGREIGADFETLRTIQSERREMRGGFTGRIYVERIDLKDEDPWVSYYASEPERFTEVKND